MRRYNVRYMIGNKCYSKYFLLLFTARAFYDGLQRFRSKELCMWSDGHAVTLEYETGRGYCAVWY